MRLPRHWLQLAALFDCLEDVLVWVKDREGRYCWVNRAFLINYAMDRRQGEGRGGGCLLGGMVDGLGALQRYGRSGTEKQRGRRARG